MITQSAILGAKWYLDDNNELALIRLIQDEYTDTSQYEFCECLQNIAEGRHPVHSPTWMDDLIEECDRKGKQLGKPVFKAKTKEQVAAERREHNDKTKKLYRIS